MKIAINTLLSIVTISNISLGLVILKKQKKSKEPWKIYFSLMSIFTALWTICIFATINTQDDFTFLLSDKFIYIFTSLIVISFLMFCIYFPYKSIKIRKITKLVFVMINLLLFYFILSDKLITGHYLKNNTFYQTENKFPNLIYGVYFLLILICSYIILYKKWILSDGINKLIIKKITIYTSIPYFLGIIFGWFFPYLGMHQFHWLGAFFTLFMNISIFYLLFKKT